MGSVIMAKVKLINFQMTDLSCIHVSQCSVHGTKANLRWHRRGGVGRLWRGLAIVFERRLALANKSNPPRFRRYLP